MFAPRRKNKSMDHSIEEGKFARIWQGHVTKPLPNFLIKKNESVACTLTQSYQNEFAQKNERTALRICFAGSLCSSGILIMFLHWKGAISCGIMACLFALIILSVRVDRSNFLLRGIRCVCFEAIPRVKGPQAFSLRVPFLCMIFPMAFILMAWPILVLLVFLMSKR